MNENSRHPFYEQWDGKPYNSFPVWVKKKYGERYQKISLDAGFTCPNKDGSKGVGGCAYCNNRSFTPSYCRSSDDLRRQLSEGIRFFSFRYRRAGKFLGYLQSYSNTYGSLDELKRIYETVLAYPGIYGLAIATRPDCVDEGILDYLEELSVNHMIFIEYGMESCYSETLRRVNRGHTFEDSVKAIEMTANRGIHIGVHLLFGLPGESRQMMLDQAGIISSLPVDTLKMHQLQVIKGTQLAKQYLENPQSFDLFTLPEYFDFIARFLQMLDPRIAVQRFFNETPPRYRIAPDWGLIRSDKLTIQFEEYMQTRGIWQGQAFSGRIAAPETDERPALGKP